MNIPRVSDEWYYVQITVNDNREIINNGKIYYFGFDFLRQLNENIKLFGYFNFSSGNLDYDGFLYYDTKYFTDRKSYTTSGSNWERYVVENKSNTNEKGSGLVDKTDYSGLVGLKVKLTPAVNLTIGISYFEKFSEITSDGITKYEIKSYDSLQRSNTPLPSYNRLRIYEEIYADLKQKVTTYSYQIPIMFDFKVGEIGELMFILNQISSGGREEEILNKTFKNRVQTNNDSTYRYDDMFQRTEYLTPKNYKYDAQAILGGKIHISKKNGFNSSNRS
ncbi:MAG: hypothetical protein ACPL25_03535 [Ignavibacteria bacterium]